MGTRRSLAAIVVIATALLFTPASASAAPPPGGPSPDPQSKLSPAVAAAAHGAPSPEPGAQDQTGRTVVQVRGGTPSELASALVDAGGTVRTVGDDSVVGAVPASELDQLAGDARIASVTEPRRPSVAALSEGVHSTGADKWQSAGLDGRGVKVGIVDVGFIGLASAQSSGALGSSVVTNASGCNGNMNGGTDHGVAVSEIVHQMAPGASLFLACITFDNDAFAAEQWLQANGVTIVNASIGDVLDGRGDGTGDNTTLAGAVRTGRLAGQLWSVAAGNSGDSHLDFTAKDTDADGYLEMGSGIPNPLVQPDATETGTFTIGNNGTIDIRMKWDAWPSTSNPLSICVWRGTASGTPLGCQNDGPGTPVSTWFGSPLTGGTYTYAIQQPSGTSFTGRVDLYFFGSEGNFSRPIDASGSLWEPATSPYAMAVGAYFYASPGTIENFSSQGPTIDNRTKPDVSGPDGVSNDVFGQFYGTSAATPHVTGAAALAKQANPAATADQIQQQFLQAKATPQGPVPNNSFGYGNLTMGQPAAPFGSLDGVSLNGPGSITFGGWAIDPEAGGNGTGSITVHIYVDSSFGTALTASGARQDVANAFGYGPNHGFGGTLSGIAGGTHTVCAYAINVGWGTNTGIGCKVIGVPGGSPFGSLDAAWVGPGSITAAGWGIDPDTTQPIAVHAYVDGAFGTAVTANGSRPDVGQAYNGYGNNHGYGLTVNGMAPGNHQICVYGINVGAGANSLLGCATVNVMSGSPFGSLDVAQGGTGTVTVAGWTIDPDTTSSIPVHVYLGSTFGGATTANLTRNDVASFFPGYGPLHGFSLQFAAAKGTYTVCAYGINTGPGSNNAVGCRNVTVN